jgi:ComB9 competence protein
MMKRALLSAAAVLALTLPAHAQTRSGPPPTPPATTPAAAPAAPAMPVPDSVVDQARAQLDGDYGHLARPRTAGQVQEVWDRAAPEAAVYTTELCDNCTYKARLREYMVTVLELPRGERIEAVDIGDGGGFSVKARGSRRLAVRPVGQGYDTSLVVYGKSGRVYPFYLRAEGFNSENVPDLVVKIEGAVTIDSDDLSPPGFALDEPASPSGAAAAGDMTEAVAGLAQTNPTTPADDFVADAAFDPNALRGWGDYTLWGDDELRPETVFRDDHFTYIRFGEKWKDIELPTAYVVVDEIDELVNTRVQGQTYIVESTRDLITLKSGKSYLCIKYEGDA